MIGLTHGSDLNSKLAAFGTGVDDVLSIPFAPEELLARVIAVMRRSYSDVVTLMPVMKITATRLEPVERSEHRRGASEGAGITRSEASRRVLQTPRWRRHAQLARRTASANRRRLPSPRLCPKREGGTQTGRQRP